MLHHKFYSPAQNPYDKFAAVNKNPANHYYSGYESFLKMIPVINTDDSEQLKHNKIMIAEAAILSLGKRLLFDAWPLEETMFPKEGELIRRTILAIDEESGAEIVMVHYNVGETPIHGHFDGYQIDALLFGYGTMIDYKLIDLEKRIVAESWRHRHAGHSIMEAGYYTSQGANRSALIHKFITHERSITLNLVPEHPRDGQGNTFTQIS